jgi:Flp pilus assembly protein TadG
MKIIKREKGQSLVEMAISLVLILVLLVGTVELGMAFFQFIQLRDAAQEGALYASIAPTDSAGIESRVRYASNSPIDLTVYTGANAVFVTIEYLGSGICEGTGNAIKVSVKYNHKIFMPFMAKVLGRTTIPLTASVTDTILSPVCP